MTVPGTVPAPAAGPVRPTRLTGYGLSVALPPRWEGRIYRRPAPTDDFASPAARAAGGRQGWAGERPHTVLHLANFPLPPGRGDYGTGAVETMGAQDVFVALLEFGAAELGTALFAPEGLPKPTAEQYDPAALQRRVAGQAGYQRFCTVTGRPMCVFVVLGSAARTGPLSREVLPILSAIEVAPA